MKRIKAFIPYLHAYRWEISIGIIALLATDLIGLAIPWILKNFIGNRAGGIPFWVEEIPVRTVPQNRSRYPQQTISASSNPR
jgi:hypothetical protein